MEDQPNRDEQEQEDRDRNREARRNRRVEWARVAASVFDGVTRILPFLKL